MDKGDEKTPTKTPSQKHNPSIPNYDDVPSQGYSDNVVRTPASESPQSNSSFSPAQQGLCRGEPTTPRLQSQMNPLGCDFSPIPHRQGHERLYFTPLKRPMSMRSPQPKVAFHLEPTKSEEDNADVHLVTPTESPTLNMKTNYPYSVPENPTPATPSDGSYNTPSQHSTSIYNISQDTPAIDRSYSVACIKSCILSQRSDSENASSSTPNRSMDDSSESVEMNASGITPRKQILHRGRPSNSSRGEISSIRLRSHWDLNETFSSTEGGSEKHENEESVIYEEQSPHPGNYQTGSINRMIANELDSTFSPVTSPVSLGSRNTSQTIDEIIRNMRQNVTHQDERDKVLESRITQQFEFLKDLGGGSFGIVSKYRRRRDNQFYAIKKTKLKKASINAGRMGEVEIQGRLPPCTNIVRLFDSWVDGDTLYIQMEFCNGGDISSLIKGENPVLQAQCSRILADISKALDVLHTFGYAHLDVKPENILSADSVYKLCDFGLCSPFDKLPSDLSLNGDAIYMCPAILLSDRKFDLRMADIFSLGISILQLALGTGLPKGGDEYEAFRKGQFYVPEHLDGDFQLLIRKMMSPEPNLRPNARSILSQLGDV